MSTYSIHHGWAFHLTFCACAYDVGKLQCFVRQRAKTLLWNVAVAAVAVAARGDCAAWDDVAGGDGCWHAKEDRRCAAVAEEEEEGSTAVETRSEAQNAARIAQEKVDTICISE